MYNKIPAAGMQQGCTMHYCLIKTIVMDVPEKQQENILTIL
jgi:hypothetical protein